MSGKTVMSNGVFAGPSLYGTWWHIVTNGVSYLLKAGNEDCLCNLDRRITPASHKGSSKEFLLPLELAL